MKKYLPFALILFVAITLRFTYLDKVPNAVSGDESHYIVTAKAVYLTGHDISGTWNPWSLLWFRYPPQEHQAELPYLLHLVSSARFPFSLLLIKLPFALLSIGVVILLYAIATELFGPAAGIATGAVAAVNPWLIVMGRTGYEAAPAMFFYLLSFWVVLKAKKWTILWAFIPLLFAFYSYIGTKVILVPFTALICLFAYIKNGKKYSLAYFILVTLSLVVTLGFFTLTKTDPSGSRLGDLFLPNSPVLSQEVNVMRKTTIASPFMSIVINKYVLYFRTILDKIFRIFSPSYLFVDGDQFFLPVSQGFFYYLDALFLLAGCVYVGVKKKAYTGTLLLLILTAMLPQLISTTPGDFSIHLSLLFPLLLILIGTGITWIYQIISKRHKALFAFICLTLYLLSTLGFVETYFYRSPLIGYADFPKRVLSRYLVLASARSIPVTVYTTSSGATFQKYILYADTITKENIPALKGALSSESIQFNGIRFLPCQNTDRNTAESTVIDDRLCGKPASAHHNSITTLTDGGENYIIGEDRVCNKYALKRYPQNITFDVFDIEHLSEQQFCETFISQR